MKTILVATLDDELHHRIIRTLAHDGEITRLVPGDSLPKPRGGTALFIVVDVRKRDRQESLDELTRYRLEAGPHAQCVAVADAKDPASIRVVTTLDDAAIAIVLSDAEDLAHVLRAHLNDPSRSAAAATACEIALRLLPLATHETLRVVLGGGFRISSVKQLATHYGSDRTSIGKALRKVTDWTPGDIIDAAKASYAAMLLRQTGYTPRAVANAVAFAKCESLDDLLERTFGLTALLVRERDRNASAGEWLERELLAFVMRRRERVR